MTRGFKTGGRQKGTPNKITAELRDAILKAAEMAGDEKGLVGYLEKQARDNPGPFMTLLGRTLPRQLTGDGGGPAHYTVSWMDEPVTKIELVAAERPEPEKSTERPSHDDGNGAVH
jgi:hypothetical protein